MPKHCFKILQKLEIGYYKIKIKRRGKIRVTSMKTESMLKICAKRSKNIEIIERNRNNTIISQHGNEMNATRVKKRLSVGIGQIVDNVSKKKKTIIKIFEKLKKKRRDSTNTKKKLLESQIKMSLLPHHCRFSY